MSTLDLKQLEQKAWRSTYEDGLWDIYYGLIVICMGFFIYRPESGYSAVNLILLLALMMGCYGLFRAGKRWITLPRMGQVQFGRARKKRKTTLAIFLAIIVLAQVGFVLVQVFARQNPEIGAQINAFVKERDDLLVAMIGALFVLPGMLLIAYFQDFPRGFYTAAVMSLAVFLMLWFNQPIYALLAGALLILPGLAFLARFIQKYPVSKLEA